MSETIFIIAAFVFILSVCPSIVCAILAHKKHYSTVLWFILGLIFSLIAILVIALLPKKEIKL
jgi:hypothetical protein